MLIKVGSQDHTAYTKEAYRQLDNNTFYRKLQHNPTNDIKTRINKKCMELLDNGNITKNEHIYMTVDFPGLYMLPIIHKELTEVPPGWPIVSACVRICCLFSSVSSTQTFFIH